MLSRLLSGEGLLTQKQVDELPAGVPIWVKWSGGNGPHRYMVYIDSSGRRYAWTGRGPPTYNPLTFVGIERMHTRVWTRDPGGAQ